MDETRDQAPLILLTDPPLLPVTLDPCPQCGAKPEKRIDGSGFGRRRITLCGECGFEFPEA